MTTWLPDNPPAFTPPDYNADGSLFDLEPAGDALLLSEAVGGQLLFSHSGWRDHQGCRPLRGPPRPNRYRGRRRRECLCRFRDHTAVSRWCLESRQGHPRRNGERRVDRPDRRHGRGARPRRSALRSGDGHRQIRTPIPSCAPAAVGSSARTGRTVSTRCSPTSPTRSPSASILTEPCTSPSPPSHPTPARSKAPCCASIRPPKLRSRLPNSGSCHRPA